MDKRILDCIYVHMQPIFDIQSNKMEYIEILVRDTREEMTATEIVKYFKDAGKCLDLDLIVIEKAIMLIKLCHLDKVRVCINICSDTMKSVGSAESILRLFGRFKVDTNYIILEINEEVDFEDETVKDNTNVLFNNNIHMALDDFGTHNATLFMLSEIKVGTVKLDKKFIEHIESNESKVEILTALFRMLSSLGINIIVEGVETIEQFDIINKIGYKYIQGFLLAKPMDVEDYIINYNA